MDAVLDRIAELALIPVVEIPEASLAVPLADALVAGGLPCAEITFRSPAAASAIEAITSARPDVLVGAGTVLCVEQLDAAAQAGARFIVSPGFDPLLVESCAERMLTVIPGALTPTEFQAARVHGLTAVKFFPAEAAGGPAYLKAIAAVFRDLRFIPTGGVDERNLGRYLKLANVMAVGGSWMASRSLLQRRDFARIEQRVRAAVELVRTLRPAEPVPTAGPGV